MSKHLLMFCLLSASCAATLPKLELKGLPDAAAYPSAKWVVLLSEQDSTFSLGKNGPEVVTTDRWRIKVLRPAVVPSLRVAYSRAFETIESIRGRVIDAEGHEKPLELSAAQDYPASSSSILFADTRVRVVPVPPVPVGGVYEYEIIRRHNNMQHFGVSQNFGDREPTKVERLVLRAPPRWDIRWKVLAYDGTALEPKQHDEAGLHVWTFERVDVAALEEEPQSPADSQRLTRVVARLETWFDPQERHPPATPEELSRQIAAVDAERAKPTPELEATVATVLKNVENTPRARAAALYEYVCREIQYCAIEIGLGGWYPHPAKDVHAARYGDCKDKANYLHTLLTIAGIQSYSAAIYSHDGTPREFSLPSLGANFNHEIAAVKLGDELVFADPTWRAVPFGELPPNDQGAPVLPISLEGHGLLMTPESTAKDNTEVQRLQVRLQPDGDAAGTFELAATGARALPWKSRWLLGTGEAKHWVEDQLWTRSALVRAVTRKPEGDFSPRVDVAGTVLVRRVASDAGDGRWFIRPMDVFDAWMQTWDTKRTASVVLRTAETRSVTLELELPAGATLVSKQVERTVEGAAGVFLLRARLEGNTLKVQQTFERRIRKLAVPSIPEFNTFVRRVLEAQAEPLVVMLPTRVSSATVTP